MKDYSKVKTFDELIELEHGKIGSESPDVHHQRNAKRSEEGSKSDSRTIGRKSRNKEKLYLKA